MPYSPPLGTVNLNLHGGYTPPVGTVDLSLAPEGEERLLVIQARTGGASAAIFAGVPRRLWGNASTAGARSSSSIAYDPNLLSAVHAVTANPWREAIPGLAGPASLWSRSLHLPRGGPDRWRAALSTSVSLGERWHPSGLTAGSGIDAWTLAISLRAAESSSWSDAERLATTAKTAFHDAVTVAEVQPAVWISTLPRLTPEWRQPWSQGEALPSSLIHRYGDGALLLARDIELWKQAGYPNNALNPGPPLPPVTPAPWGTALRIACPLPGTALQMGRVPCVLIAEREVAKRKTYMSTNSASLARWPDLTPLPCTSMTVETDFDSWCWSLTATLSGSDAWGLVQPNPLACEVLATINGQAWKFLLDVPSNARAFGSNRVSLKGRSRSAWLHSPYTPSRNLSESNPRQMAQLADEALTNSGWTIDWQLPNWLVPAYRYNSQNTPIGALVRLVNTTHDGLYTDPIAQIITAQPRWPVASWLLDGAVADLLVPADAVISLTQSPVYTQPLNGVYVSGTTHGALALVKIAGTDGAMQPDAPLIDELLCDPEGVAARQCGLNTLSDSGTGFEMDADLLFTPEVGLVRPGLVVSIAGMKGVSRSVQVSATWSGDALKVRQSVGLERREVEA